MIVFCEECGSRNEVEPELYQSETNPARCEACRDVLNKLIAKKIRMQEMAGVNGDEVVFTLSAASETHEGIAQEAEAAPELPAIVEPLIFSPAGNGKCDILDASDLDRNLGIDNF
ncbi:MAG: hypothetical protein AB1921_17645 [Thermodesulfobacteriota bacterium]